MNLGNLQQFTGKAHFLSNKVMLFSQKIIYIYPIIIYINITSYDSFIFYLYF